MNKSYLTHLLSFLAGAVVIYFTGNLLVFKEDSNNVNIELNSKVTDLSSQTNEDNTGHSSEDSNYLTSQSQLRMKIAQLEALLAKGKENRMPITEVEDPSETETATETSQLQKMSYTDFEHSMKTSFTDQFKGVVLQFEGKRLEDIKKSYQSSSDKNEWSAEYENRLASYVTENDINGDHFIQSLDCNSSICRLEVNTNDSQNWDQLYSALTRETWYESITIQEKSDYPGNVIYYLPSMKN
ncbi:MAG: hypothetical protein KUG78_15645 [Kangiellaceae bacterium]|nr:hypothetical protein [Kangiellaceae bacterium]